MDDVLCNLRPICALCGSKCNIITRKCPMCDKRESKDKNNSIECEPIEIDNDISYII